MEPPKKYSQLRAFWGILRSSLIASYRNISGLVFSFIFPLIFILVFGYIGQSSTSLSLALNPQTDANNPVVAAVRKIDSIKLTTDQTQDEINDNLRKGQVDGELSVTTRLFRVGSEPLYDIKLTTSAAAPQQGQTLTAVIGGIIDKMNIAAAHFSSQTFDFNTSEISGRKFTQIDFILPGQLGFSLLNLGIFATAFLFLTLRQTLVIKRFFATPVKRFTIIIGEGISRLIFSIIQATIIILVGILVFHYTLVNGFVTYLQMMALVTLGLLVFLGFGFIISSVAKDERTVPPMAQLVALPQFLLAGTFFPIDVFPSWLQPIARALPLTFLNDALRKVAFEGSSLIAPAVTHDIFYLALWGIGAYILAVRLFRWE